MSLPGFEKETADLSSYERFTLVPLFIRGFKNKYGEENAVSNKQIVANLKRGNYKINDSRVRKIVSYIRDEGLIPGLVASSKGYYVSRSETDIFRWIQSLEGRETKIRMIRKRAEEYLATLRNKNQVKLNF